MAIATHQLPRAREGGEEDKQVSDDMKPADAHVVRFRHLLGDEVWLVDIQRNGRVNGLCVRQWGITYSVVWWADCKRHEEWVYEWEIESKSQSK